MVGAVAEGAGRRDGRVWLTAVTTPGDPEDAGGLALSHTPLAPPRAPRTRPGRVTPEGQRLLDFPTHPRLAHLLTGGAEAGLGPLAAEAHVAIGHLAGDLGVTEVLAVGEFAEQVCEGARLEGVAARVCHRDDVAAQLELNSGDVVLIKGSRGVGLEAVGSALMEDNA